MYMKCTLKMEIKIRRHIDIRVCKILSIYGGARGGVVVKALCYKPAGLGFDSRWCH